MHVVKISTRSIMDAGAIVLLALVMSLLFYHYTVVTRHADFAQIVVTKAGKVKLTSELIDLARRRPAVLVDMLSSTDPFELEDLSLELAEIGSDYLVRRSLLLELMSSAQEQATLGAVDMIAMELGARSQTVAELARSPHFEDRELARGILYGEIFPEQHRLITALNGYTSLLLESYESRARPVTDQGRMQPLLQLILSLAGLSIVGIIMLSVNRRIVATEAQLEDEKLKAELTLACVASAVFLVGESGRIEYMNGAAERLTGWKFDDAREEPLEKVLPLCQTDSGWPVIDEILGGDQAQGDDASSLDLAFLTKSGEIRRICIESSPIPSKRTLNAGVVVTVEDVTENRAMTSRLEHQATHDMLTGLYNRRAFEQTLGAMLDDSKRAPRHALLVMDIDQFKVINDTWGHMAGDDLLRKVAKIIKKRARSTDLVARLGGDEFAVLLKDCGEDGARRISRDILEDVRAFVFTWEEQYTTLTISIGGTIIEEHVRNITEIISTADTACYAAKEGGRNQVHLVSLGDEEIERRRFEMGWVHRIKKALEEGSFFLEFQEIRGAQELTEGCQHFEALIRMRDLDGKALPPMAFIPAAERYGLMHHIDRWVFDTVVALIDQDLRNGRDRVIAMNLSGDSLSNDDLRSYILNMASSGGIAPGRLCVELTETTAIRNIDVAREFMAALRSNGVKVALDDFGSGFSSFGYLKNLPLDFLKIDGVFIREILSDQASLVMVKAINEVGHALGLKTVAEFVEDSNAFEILKALGVDFVQGYYIGRPGILNDDQQGPESAGAAEQGQGAAARQSLVSGALGG